MLAIFLTKNSKTTQPEIIIDTSTFFSALYNPSGNEALLFSLADNHFCFLHIIDYVLQELREVFKRKHINQHLINDLLDTYNNITLSELESVTTIELERAKKVIKDPYDRPIFIFAYRRIHQNKDSFLVSGDKGFFRKPVQDQLYHHVLHTKDAIKKITQ